MNLDKLKKNFVSDVDQLLENLDAKNQAKPESVRTEVNKHQRIAKLRDDANAVDKTQKIWRGF